MTASRPRQGVVFLLVWLVSMCLLPVAIIITQLAGRTRRDLMMKRRKPYAEQWLVDGPSCALAWIGDQKWLP